MSARCRVLAFAAALAGCGTDTAQTAVRPTPPAPLDCKKTNAPVTLPDDPALGGGDELTTSPLLGSGYGAGQGPGIALVARDGFRLYQNDELVAESTASLDPVFVPLTFLPGDNVVSVVVASPERAPMLLADIEELERSYPSDGSWKVNTAPTGNYRLPSYDASGWSDADDLGLAVTTPGCEPPVGFVPGSSAHWIGTGDAAARTAVFRFAFRIAPLGHGRSTTGGGDATPVVATDLDSLVSLLASPEPNVVLLREGSMDLRKTGNDVLEEPACPLACEDGSEQITHYALSDMMTCPEPTVPIQRNERHLFVNANKTLVGLGRGSTLRGLWLTTGENVILRNLAFYDVNPEIIEAGDGVSVEGSRAWLDHLTFRFIGDGFIDTGPARELTLSWIHFDGRSEWGCGGYHPRANELSNSVATVYSCFYDHVSGRAPTANHPDARVHLFNNFVRDDPDYGVGATCGAKILVEGTYFENVAHATSRHECPDDPSVGAIFARDNVYDTTQAAHVLMDVESDEPHDAMDEPDYPYTVAPAESVRHTVPERAGAGSRWPRPFEL